jgi:hypothetical protein
MSTDVVRGYRAKMMPCYDGITIDTEVLNEVLKPFINKRVATGCPLCDKIWSSKEAYRKFIDDSWEEQIVIVMEDGKPYLYIPIQMDSYYSDTYLQINFCPKCGRALMKEGVE